MTSNSAFTCLCYDLAELHEVYLSRAEQLGQALVIADTAKLQDLSLLLALLHA